MRLGLVAVGRLKNGPERELVGRYSGRIDPLLRGLGLKGFDIAELAESRARSVAERQEAEGVAILARADGALAVCDERGPSPTSAGFATTLATWRQEGRPSLTFVIGGADGLSESVRRRAALTISFGCATLPHQLVRVLLLEQVYRALTILSGHPYHRDG